METLATGMQNIRISQVLSQSRRPRPEDLERLEDGLLFIRRSLAAVSYLEEGTAEGLEPIALTEARYTSKTVRELHLATDYPSFRALLEKLAASLRQCIESQTLPDDVEKGQLESFFGIVGEAMVSEALDGSLVEEEDSL